MGRHGASSRRAWWYAVVALLLAAGVGWMHTTATAVAPAAASTMVHTAASTMVHIGGHAAPEGQACPAPKDEPCPAPDHGRDHAGSMCQAPAPDGGLPVPILPAVGLPDPARPTGLLATVVPDANDGTGCGPPSLEMLSVRRT